MLSAFGLTFGSCHWIASVHAGVQTPTGTIMLSTLTLILGIQFLMQGVSLDVQSVPARPVAGDLTPETIDSAIVFPVFTNDRQTGPSVKTRIRKRAAGRLMAFPACTLSV